MKILGIETSCDDTAIAVLEVRQDKKTPNFDVLANIVSSQTEVHKQYGGVYPALAKREHQRNLTPVFAHALKEAELLNPKSEYQNPKQIQNSKLKILNSILEREPELEKQLIPFLKKYKKPDIDLIAVTNGPGLEPCLWVGVNFAKALSYFWNIPIIPVNHIESHILVNLLQTTKYQLQTPAIALVVSGGHTQIILVRGIGKYKVLGETRDDAAGECFDKCAKILGLGYPGGPAVAKIASQLQTTNYSLKTRLPRPMINTKDYDFSFSGLKTAVLYQVKKDRAVGQSAALSKKYKSIMAAEVQQAIIDVLLKKTIKAAKDFKARSIILGGGVSANKELRRQLIEKVQKAIPNAKCFIPDVASSTDNALMTAITGFYHQKDEKNLRQIKADGNLRIN